MEVIDSIDALIREDLELLAVFTLSIFYTNSMLSNAFYLTKAPPNIKDAFHKDKEF